jgi:hypothetical protein
MTTTNGRLTQMDTQVYSPETERLLAVLNILLIRGEVIPVDLHAHLVAQGIDVQAILNRK